MTSLKPYKDKYFIASPFCLSKSSHPTTPAIYVFQSQHYVRQQAIAERHTAVSPPPVLVDLKALTTISPVTILFRFLFSHALCARAWLNLNPVLAQLKRHRLCCRRSFVKTDPRMKLMFRPRAETN